MASFYDDKNKIFNLQNIPKAEHNFKIILNAQEKEAFAKQAGMLKIKHFEALLQTMPYKNNGIKIDGRLKVNYDQACNVSLEPMAQKMDIHFCHKVRLLDETSHSKQRVPKEILIDPTQEEEDWIEEDTLSLMEVFLEYFILNYDEYARIEGVSMISLPEAIDEEETKKSPFEVLKRLM